MHGKAKRLKIFTWHIHGSYLYYLSLGDYELYIPLNPEKGSGYQGRGETFPFDKNVIEIPEEEVKNFTFDCILFQSKKNFTTDQYATLSQKQRDEISKIFLEHDPPRKHPTDTIHVLDDPTVSLVHVTSFNKLMWKNRVSDVRVIAHGVPGPDTYYKGELERGVVVVNDLFSRGRRLGADIFLEMRKYIPLDLIGLHSEEYGGLGEIPLPVLPDFLSHYRFFFNPIRYTSLGLSVCEAMMLGMPIVGLATTEMVTTVKNNISGFIETDPSLLIEKMKLLISDKRLASNLGKNAQKDAERKFNIQRFTTEWENLFQSVTCNKAVLS